MIVGVSIEKATAFRGGVQPFANVYYYEAPLAVGATGEWDDLVNYLVTKEKTIHATTVSFVRARLWKADGTKAENEMIIDKALSGTGSLTASTVMDKERAVLVQIRAGVDSRGRPVRLKKWFHICAQLAGGEFVTNENLTQVNALTQAARNNIAAYGEDLKEIGVGVGASTICTLTAKSGRNVTGAATAHPYLEHHQLGDQWRG